MTISLSRVFYMIPEPDVDEEANSSEEHKQTLFENEGSSCLSKLHLHNCLVNILDFLTFEEMNNFSRVSRECYNVRCHKHLDQTRSGTICLGNGVQSIVQLMLKVREQEWHKSFRGNRTHLHLAGLNCLSSDIESIDEQFIKQCSPLKHVTSLDCSEVHLGSSQRSLEGSSSGEEYEDSSSSSDGDDVHTTSRHTSPPQTSSSSSSWLFRYQDYIDKGFAHGLALSLLVPNLREIDMSYLPLTSLGVAWIAENNPKLERIRWNRSLIWPINHHAYDILRACRNLKELYIDDARLLFGPGRTRRRRRLRRRQRREQQLEDPDPLGDNNGFRRNNIGLNEEHNNNNNNNNNNAANNAANNEDSEALWASLTENVQSLEKVSCRRARWYNQNSKFITIGETEEGQASLMRFVRSAGNLKWFRSDLTDDNIAIMAKERPDVVFCR
eukprot:CAMPEP_0116106858 /NCGR_PEP_ID=MMETSP0327-20121206/15883_1 /TAXON_ID=44447 /ORGANISM="Pseudo-nitzschia delicatissima, Strain B596" /LENGTH=440 /DNA_ID=CAMNT_0003599545 /DNA_START=108 /DNA_END=1430 /DNA_ORIENTATION=+